jgi:hypothetical protein
MELFVSDPFRPSTHRPEDSMAKLRLQLDDLVIDSFTTTYVKREKGTVYGEQCTCQTACTCPGCPTCYASCNGTCGATCNTCGASCGGTCAATCDFSCGGTCDASCGGDTCDYTCMGFVTYGPGMACVIC